MDPGRTQRNDTTGSHRLLQLSFHMSELCSSLHLLPWLLQQRFAQGIDSITFQVDWNVGKKDLRMFKGRQRFRNSRRHALHARHVIELTQFLLRSSDFKVGLDRFCRFTVPAWDHLSPQCFVLQWLLNNNTFCFAASEANFRRRRPSTSFPMCRQ